MIEEINEGLEDLGAAVALFLVTGQEALSYRIDSLFERRVRIRALFATSQSRYKIFAEDLSLSFKISPAISNLRFDALSYHFWRRLLPHIWSAVSLAESPSIGSNRPCRDLM